MPFALPDPFVKTIRVNEAAIDAYGHVNNSVYVGWCDEVAWAHSAALGLPIEACLDIGCGMAVHRSRFEYVKAAYAGDELQLATWILGGDGRLRVGRRFEFLRPADDATLFRGQIDYVCLNLKTGRATRMPEPLASAYAVLPSVAAALERTS